MITDDHTSGYREPEETNQTRAERYLESTFAKTIFEQNGITLDKSKTCPCDKTGTIWFYVYYVPQTSLQQASIEKLLKLIITKFADVPIAFMAFTGKEITRA